MATFRSPDARTPSPQQVLALCAAIDQAAAVNYYLPLFRPPSEAESLILQATVGCSHNRCGFCSMYRMKRFRVLEPAEFAEQVRLARQEYGEGVRRVFLADGDAMCLSFGRLEQILDVVNAAFPRLQRIGIYANARDVLAKSETELEQLRAKKLKILYMGLESGDSATLTRIGKGATPEQIVGAVKRAEHTGIRSSVMVLVGLAGRSRSREHAEQSAFAVNEMSPSFTSLLTYTPTPQTPLFDEVEKGQFELPTPIETLREIHTFVSRLECKTYFACNHASNYLPLVGHMPSAKNSILAAIESAIDGKTGLSPEWLRGM